MPNIPVVLGKIPQYFLAMTSNHPSKQLSFRISFPSLARSLSALETWGFGLSGLLLWLGTAPGMHFELGERALWVWLPGTIVGILLSLQVKHLGSIWQDVSGGTPNYTTRLLEKQPGLARYVAIGYWLGWVSVPAMNAIILTDVIKENLVSFGIPCPEIGLKIGFTLIPFIVAFSGTRALSILHLFFILPAVGLMLLFCLQGLGWLAFAAQSPGITPATWASSGVPTIAIADWAKWFFVAVYAVYAGETASSFVAESQKPRVTLKSLSVAAGFWPIVYLGGSWVLMRLATTPNLQNSAFLEIEIAAQPFWGKATSVVVTFLIVSGCLLSSATAVSNTPRILYQMALDGYLAPVFGMVSRRGVMGPSLAFTGLLSLGCLVWGDVARVVMVTGTGYLISMIGIHWGMWLRRKEAVALWPRWSLFFCLVEMGVLVVGGLAWNWQDLLVGLLLPIAVLLINEGIKYSHFCLFQPNWWMRWHQTPAKNFADPMLVQVGVLIVLICGATTIGWTTRSLVTDLTPDRSANVFVVLLQAIAFVGVAIACWTSLPQVTAVIEAREAAEHLFIIAQDGIVVIDEAGIIQRANPSAKALLQQNTSLMGQLLTQYLPDLPIYPEDWSKRGQQTFPFLDSYKTLDMSVSDRANQSTQEYVVILRDITEQEQATAQLKQQAQELEQALKALKQTQTKLVHSEKMSGLGQLVAGVAHEINNPVNFIFGNVTPANQYTQDLLKLIHLYQTHYPTPHPEIQTLIDEIELEFLIDDLPKLLQSMKVGAERIQNIVLSLRIFSRMDEADMKIVDIHEGIDSTLMLLQSRLKAKANIAPIQVMKHYANLPAVECYAGQLNQVFMHILTNAIDALEELGSDRAHCPQAPTTPSPSDTLPPFPTITIKTEMLSGERILIQISNNGARIPDVIQKRLFEPFFTTKPIGKGTGLGLSISYGIVTERHGGQLQCISLPGEETTFVIEIPQHQSVKSA
jgi:signal transduction histidine kinase